jgi:epidermal growth factor receptor substrate 15
MSTPLGDEDVEPVKQITAMGFSRTQAVDALEKNGYDVQKAINILLGAP